MAIKLTHKQRIRLRPRIPDKTRRHKRRGISAISVECSPPRNRRAPALVKAWERLHALSSHSPVAIEKKWAATSEKFYRTHFGVNGTMRYLNAYSCHSFL